MDAIQIVTAFALSISFVLCLWAIKGFLLKPVIGGNNMRVTVTLLASGSAKELERTLSGLIWLRENGTLHADILIIDAGMDTAAAEIARLTSKDHASVRVCTRENIEKYII
ncbi:MAG: hypothetical protein RR743_00630 [Oscillospiraceae bacterium]